MAEEYFKCDGERVRGNHVQNDVKIVIDMETPEYEAILPLFEVMYSDMTERKMLNALNVVVYQKVGELSWQTSYEVNNEERVYDYFETYG